MDSSNHIGGNQTDYILVNKTFRNSIQSIKTYAGADIRLDHNPLLGQFKIKLKQYKKKEIKIKISAEQQLQKRL